MALDTIDFSNPSRLKTIAMVFALGLGIYILGPPLYWEFMQGPSTAMSSCPPCLCDCSTLDLANDAIAVLGNLSMTGCGRISETDDSNHNRPELTSEEIQLQESVYEESQQHADMALLEVKKVSSQYQKEAEKCNIGIQTSEDAREKAENALELQKEQSILWENRARLLGWSNAKSKKSVEPRKLHHRMPNDNKPTT